MSYIGLSRNLLADAGYARRLLVLGFEGEAKRILADHADEPIAAEAVALIEGNSAKDAISRLDALAASLALA